MIDVVVPVYKGLEETRRCLESVLRAPCRASAEVVVIDDLSPEPAMEGYLGELAAAGRITLLRNERNLGFVQSVNRGMALHPDRDVVLLNSDTEVANDWLDRLLAAAGSERVATVTPFSNNATICSYPFEGWPGGVPGGLGLAGLDRQFAAANAGRTLELPTGVGFCLLIRRAALDALGAFDAARFGRGYGEENDFCMRAGKAGWRNVLAADVFVYHEGSVSFSAERAERIDAATRALVEVHPEYPRAVQDFIHADPAAPLRSAVDAARIAQGPAEAAHVLAERAQERSILLGRFAELQEYAQRKGDEVIALSEGLAHAQQVVAERDRAHEQAARDFAEAIGRLEAEMAALRAGLARAEALAFERLAELDRIKSFRLWRLYSLLMGTGEERRRADGQAGR